MDRSSSPLVFCREGVLRHFAKLTGKHTFLTEHLRWLLLNGQILILDEELNDTNFRLINFYSSNSVSNQLHTFSTLQKLPEKIDDYKKMLFLEVILI